MDLHICALLDVFLLIKGFLNLGRKDNLSSIEIAEIAAHCNFIHYSPGERTLPVKT